MYLSTILIVRKRNIKNHGTSQQLLGKKLLVKNLLVVLVEKVKSPQPKRAKRTYVRKKGATSKTVEKVAQGNKKRASAKSQQGTRKQIKMTTFVPQIARMQSPIS